MDEKAFCRIIEDAIEREIQAYMFYLTIASKVPDNGLRELYIALAAEELDHKKLLELELMKIGKVVSKHTPIPQINPEMLINSTENDLQIDYKDSIMMAIKKEQAAFETYSEMASKTKDIESKRVFLELAQQELKHKLKFQQEYDNIINDGF